MTANSRSTPAPSPKSEIASNARSRSLVDERPGPVEPEHAGVGQLARVGVLPVALPIASGVAVASSRSSTTWNCSPIASA
ncbi:MAG: hypothetical protein R3B49_06540 [Phycisphaerales bacterium]